MSGRSILEFLRVSGLHVMAEGDNLRIGPQGLLTPETLELVREHKPELLEAVRAEGSRFELSDKELLELVGTIYAKDSPEDQAEAIKHALSDPRAALECYRWIASRSVH